MKEIRIAELIMVAKPGDCLMTSNPEGLGMWIRWFQEMQGDPAFYTHVAIITDCFLSPLGKDTYVLEANKTLDYKPLKQYIGKPVCLLRHKDMTPALYLKGFEAIRGDIGRKYPYRRLLLHAIDNSCNWALRKFHVKPKVFLARWIKFSVAVCSEWYAKMLCAAGLMKEWGGVDPDWFDDRREEDPETWQPILEGILVE